MLFSFPDMQIIEFRLLPLFALVAALFAPQALAEDAAVPANDPALLMQVPLDAGQPLLNTQAANEPADLWTRVRQGFKMDNLDNAQVRAQEQFYAKHPEYMRRVVERSRRYLYFIVGEVERRGMPTELALLPIVESAFVPRAQSHALASGLWQFIPSTGQRYGLERTWWYDGRQDVMAATYAALDYLQDLYNLFGDWQLALAAYNWGEGGVGRALAKTRARGLDDDFETIKKPRETENYVPKLIAVRNIIANPEAYGIKIPSVPDQPYFQPVSTGKHMDLQLAAKLAGTTLEELMMLNPGFIRPVFAHKEDRKLLLPIDKVETFERNLKSYDAPLLSWQPYVTKRGESLDAIADKFSIALAELKDVNKLGNARAANGQTILVPIRGESDANERQNLASLIAGSVAAIAQPEADDPAPAQASRATTVQRHKVSRGDTLFGIAKRYGMQVAELKALNGLTSNNVPAGRLLKVSAEAEPAPAVRGKPAAGKLIKVKTRQHVVRRGDTLDEIARKYDVSVSELKKWNRPVARGVLKVGFKLQIRQES
ncbi:membrane-bound lytic murein transglycosylase D [Chitinimonas taiwanensis DSM 18899]|uniref:Membrane-bound lytic murein transglycosylase D n=2 Tax=Chitinimonas TaxID=240411 RepID=A0A1K2HC67_9NEIS|nr:membrane-bound lytic murein transglycosylase D [Chitinimonas taiwanensis DSM 18899]